MTSLSKKTKSVAKTIPLLTIAAGPRDEKWIERLKQEYNSLIEYQKINKKNDNEWFQIEAIDDLGTKWKGTVWFYHEYEKYEFKVEFEIPVTFPTTPPELILAELEGKTLKMYHGGKICLDDHFKPLWKRNAPKFGIAHAFALGMAPWLAAEIPFLIDAQVLLKGKQNNDENDDENDDVID